MNRTQFERSYTSHEEHYCQYANGEKHESLAKTWLQEDTVDSWRHHRMYQLLNPILLSQSNSKWLTVGDGRYGLDAKFIIDNGGEAIASDISDVLLKEAHEAGYLPAFKKENAECLSFEDSSFDYVFCKESYHHFPRPIIALYEMLRVAKKGVILIEPNDPYINNKALEIFFRNIKNLLKRILGMKAEKHDYEESGNYVYRVSRREIEKVALGLNFPYVAFKGINDAFLWGVEEEKLHKKGPVFRKIWLLIGVQNLLCRMGLTDYGMLAAVIFKTKPDKNLQKLLLENGFALVALPANPYL